MTVTNTPVPEIPDVHCRPTSGVYTNKPDSQKPPFLPGVLIKSNPVQSEPQNMGGAGAWWSERALSV